MLLSLVRRVLLNCVKPTKETLFADIPNLNIDYAVVQMHCTFSTHSNKIHAMYSTRMRSSASFCMM